MFWPLALPFDITCWVFAVACIITLVFAFLSARSTFVVASLGLLACLLSFIPSCIGIAYVVDQYRFGEFTHGAFDDVDDFRIERYLPPAAIDISLFKHFHGNGYLAKYSITEAELTDYLDGMWTTYEEYSAIKREEFHDYGQLIDSFDSSEFDPLDWGIPASVRVYHSPVESDGGGATCYYDSKSGVALQTAGYW